MSAKIKSQTGSASRSHKHKPRGLSDHKFERVYWPYIPIILLAGLLLIFTTRNHVLAALVRHPASQVLAYATDISPDELLSDTNAVRLANSDKPLALNTSLSQAAQAKADDMARRDYWSHNTPDGSPPWIFVDAQGYHYQKLGENLATGFADAQTTVNGWMASSEHRRNMLDSAYSEVGFGFANVADYRAAGGGAMTVVVAFYGDPVGVSDAANNQLLSAGVAGPTTTPTLPDKSESTSRAQIAFARLPIAGHATLIASFGLVLVAGFWLGRHVLSLRRVLVQGESFIFSHPMLDVGLIFIGLALFALTRTAGLVR
jgi:Cysteine-rich secretory protein family